MYIDAHNHLHQIPDSDTRIREMRDAGLAGCVVNSTSEDDWPLVACLARQHPGFVHPAFGLHPWHAHRRSPGWLDALRRFLDQFPRATIGECGLDRWTREPSIEVQLEVFRPQLALARERCLPLTIHVLKAWGPLLEALGAEPPPARGFLLHSYSGSPELIRQLVPLGARFSFSGHFLHPRKAASLESFRRIPPDRLLLETDAPAMLPPPEIISHPLPHDQNHPANLPSIATALASHLGEAPASLIERCTRNTRQLFLPGDLDFDPATRR